MSAQPKPDVDPYADETGPLVSQALFDDLSSANPSPAARAFMIRMADEALADPDPGVPADEVFERLEDRFRTSGSRIAD
jgi:hypothetical protein